MTTIPLTDLDDPRVSLFRDVRDADLRGAHGLFLVESEACVRRWLHAVAARRRGAALPPAVDVHSLLLSPERVDSLRPAILAAIGDAPGAAPVFSAPAAAVASISGYSHHHGALGLGRRAPDAPPETLLAALPPGPCTLLVAMGVVHVDNAGALFRNAAAFGAGGILLGPGCADPLTRKAVRISMGRVFSVPWGTFASLPQLLPALRAAGFRVVAAEHVPGAVDVERLPHHPRNAFLLGAEGAGLAPEALAAADAVCRIATVIRPPDEGPDEGISLNVAVASAILLHEANRARG